MSACAHCGHTPHAPDCPEAMSFHGSRRPLPATLRAISDEVVSARLHWPGNHQRLHALSEEVMELFQAMLGRKPWKESRKEAIQVAAMAIRLIEEGDREFPEEGSGEEGIDLPPP